MGLRPVLCPGRAGFRTLLLREPMDFRPDQLPSAAQTPSSLLQSLCSLSRGPVIWDAHGAPCSQEASLGEEAGWVGHPGRAGIPGRPLSSWEDVKPLRVSVSPSVKWGLAENPHCRGRCEAQWVQAWKRASSLGGLSFPPPRLVSEPRFHGWLRASPGPRLPAAPPQPPSFTPRTTRRVSPSCRQRRRFPDSF